LLPIRKCRTTVRNTSVSENVPIPRYEITRSKPACAAHHNQGSIPVQRNGGIW
jgi:hypothetical protein